MFAIEIEFSDGISLPEVIFVRRTSAILGTSETAHVFIEAAQPGVTDIRVTRGLGRKFRTEAVRRPTESENIEVPTGMVGEFVGHGDIQFGSVKIHIVALDADSLLDAEEAPDRGAIRVLRNGLVFPPPTFPAIAVLGGTPVLLSFSPRVPISIGRSRNCLVRFDTSDVSSEHARIGCEGGRCWIEDLGSTNGTFVAGNKIEGRKPLDVEDVITIGSEVALAVVYRNDDIGRLQNKHVSKKAVAPTPVRHLDSEFEYDEEEDSEYESPRGLLSTNQSKFPILFSRNEHVRPTRFVLGAEGKLTIGRDPANDIWINTPHISRCHLQIEWFEDGSFSLVDESSNGSFVDGMKLLRDQPVRVGAEAREIDLGGGVQLYIARSEEEETQIQRELEHAGLRKSPLNFQDEPAEEDDEVPFTPRTLIATRVELPRVREEDLRGFSELDDEGEDFEGYDEEPEQEDYAPDSRPGGPEESEQYQLLDEEDEGMGFGSQFSRLLLVLLMVLVLVFAGLVFLGFFADKFFY